MTCFENHMKFWTFWTYLKTKTFFQKLEYRFLVESTKIENAIFPYNTALSEPNVEGTLMQI